jgi:D-beta-D-heptose 7-phosphate kinase/D-beta-D-heptose 1-phosphate adenosyltransferase
MVHTRPNPELLADAVERWSGRPVLVVGDVVLDDWRFTRPRRLYRETATPVLALLGQQDAAGAAGNTAVNLAVLGARPVLVAALGDDDAGTRVRACLRRAGVVDATVTLPAGHTPVKRRLVAADRILSCEEEWVVDPDAPTRGGTGITAMLEEIMVEDLPADLVICDYGLGSLDRRVHGWLAGNRDRFATVSVDAHDPGRWSDVAPTVITPSFSEAAPLLPRSPVAHLPADPAGTIVEGAAELLRRTGAGIAAVTLDSAGALVVTRAGQRYRTRARPASDTNTIGAGDAYLAALALALAVGEDIPVAAELAQLAAGETLNAVGTCVCSRTALLAAATENNAAPGGARQVDAAQLTELVRDRRQQGMRIVFTNGCFDVLHSGHVGYLAQARELGDLLIVAVNSDASVRRLKGPQRPVNSVADRVAVLAALRSVDLVVVFEEDSPAALIEAVRPDVYVKGGDYPPDLVPEAPLVRRLGGEALTLGYVPDRSTSAIIQRIRSHDSLSDSRTAR